METKEPNVTPREHNRQPTIVVTRKPNLLRKAPIRGPRIKFTPCMIDATQAGKQNKILVTTITNMSLISNLLLKSRFYCYHAILAVWYVLALLSDESSIIKNQVSNLFRAHYAEFFVQFCTGRLGVLLLPYPLVMDQSWRVDCVWIWNYAVRESTLFI